MALIGASMANIDEKIDEAVASIPKASIDETLGLLGASMAVVPPADPSTPEYSKQVIEKKLIDLGVQMFVLMHHEQNIKDASAKLEAESRRLRGALSRYTRPDFPPRVLIRFGDMLEEANQYFDFKLRAKKTHEFKHYSSPDVISATLLKDQLLLSEFPKIGEPHVTQAAHAIFWELDNEKDGNEHARPKRDRALQNLIYKLAFLTRELGYAMDEDPFVELAKIMEFEPYAYDERSIQEAHSKYSQLVSSMVAKYEEALGEKPEVRTTATGAIDNEASGEKHELTTIATSARNKGASDEKPEQEVTSNVSEKPRFTITANVTGTKSKRSFGTIKKYPKKLKTNKASKNG